MNAGAAPAGPSRSKVRWFALAIVAFPMLVLASSFWLASTDWFVAHATPAYLQWMDAQYSIRNRDCAILIFGDSTALTGLEPRLIAQRTGLSACGIAQTRGVVGALGTDLLDHYLRQNPAPRWIVIALSPDNWHEQKQWDEIAFGEGLFLMVRHSPARTWLRAAVLHPAVAFSFALHVDELMLARLVGKALGWAPLQIGPDPGLELGHMTMTSPPEDHCVMNDLRTPPAPRPPDPAYMAGLRARYSRPPTPSPATPGTSVLLVVSPVPECDSRAAWYLTHLAGLLDSPLREYPIGQFNSLDRHYTRAGSQRYSTEVADLIVAKEQAAAGKSASHPSLQPAP
jgi:hypothetical protein